MIPAIVLGCKPSKREVDSTKESSDDEYEYTKMIQSTLDYIIQRDRKEVMELLIWLKEVATEDYIDTSRDRRTYQNISY